MKVLLKSAPKIVTAVHLCTIMVGAMNQIITLTRGPRRLPDPDILKKYSAIFGLYKNLKKFDRKNQALFNPLRTQ